MGVRAEIPEDGHSGGSRGIVGELIAPVGRGIRVGSPSMHFPLVPVQTGTQGSRARAV
jgi:hypothetical protein